MKEKQRQPQPDGAIISNLRYAYGMLFREYPITRLLLPLTVLVSVLFPLTGNLLPAMIVAMLEKRNLAGFVAAVAAVGMVMLLLKWGQNVLNQNLAYYTMECRNRTLTMQAIVEARILTLENQLKNVKIVEKSASGAGIASLGSFVTIRDVEFGDEMTYRIISSVESSNDMSTITDESPVGKALLGHKAGDAVYVTIPSGEQIEYQIIKVE